MYRSSDKSLVIADLSCSGFKTMFSGPWQLKHFVHCWLDVILTCDRTDHVVGRPVAFTCSFWKMIQASVVGSRTSYFMAVQKNVRNSSERPNSVAGNITMTTSRSHIWSMTSSDPCLIAETCFCRIDWLTAKLSRLQLLLRRVKQMTLLLLLLMRIT